MKTILTFAALFWVSLLSGQHEGKLWHEEIQGFQEELNQEFSDPEESPLLEKDLQEFTGLTFFPANDTFYVAARFIRTIGEEPFEMPTTTDRKPVYVKFGELRFQIEGKQFSLSVYQNRELIKEEGYEDYLFLPFNDLTNGRTTYGGGRFLDFRIPTSNKVMLDFNKAYNPYCAYNHNYSCPIPPEENSLPIMVNAGVMAYEK